MILFDKFIETYFLFQNISILKLKNLFLKKLRLKIDIIPENMDK